MEGVRTSCALLSFCAESATRPSFGCEHRSAWGSFADRQNGAADSILGYTAGVPTTKCSTRLVSFGARLYRVHLYLNKPSPVGVNLAAREIGGTRSVTDEVFQKFRLTPHPPLSRSPNLARREIYALRRMLPVIPALQVNAAKLLRGMKIELVGAFIERPP